MLTNGSSGYARWYPGYPNNNRDHNRLAIEIPTKPGPSSNERGMFNINPDYSSIPLCQYAIE